VHSPWERIPGVAAFPQPCTPYPALISGSQHRAAFLHLLLQLSAQFSQFSQSSSPAGPLHSTPRCDRTLPQLRRGSGLPEWMCGAAPRCEPARSWEDASLLLAHTALTL